MPEMASAQAALAGIAAAADSVDALSVAIKQAAFVDEHPGEARQKLRGESFECYSLRACPGGSCVCCLELCSVSSRSMVELVNQAAEHLVVCILTCRYSVAPKLETICIVLQLQGQNCGSCRRSKLQKKLQQRQSLWLKGHHMPKRYCRMTSLPSALVLNAAEGATHVYTLTFSSAVI